MATNTAQDKTVSGSLTNKTDPRKPYVTVILKKVNGRIEIDWQYDPTAEHPCSMRDLRIMQRTIQTTFNSHRRAFNLALLKKQRESKSDEARLNVSVSVSEMQDMEKKLLKGE